MENEKNYDGELTAVTTAVPVMTGTPEPAYAAPAYAGSAANAANGANGAKRGREKKTRISASGLSLPARIGIWTVGVVSGLTVLMLCAVAWVFGINYLGSALSPEKQTAAQNQQSAPQGGGNGGNFFFFPDENGGWSSSSGDNDENDGGYPGSSIFPGWNGGNGNNNGNNNSNDNDGGDINEASKPTAGFGITTGAIEPDIPIEGYSGGMLIQSIKDGSAFDGLDVREYDLIVAFDGVPTPDMDSLDAQLKKHDVGDRVRITLARYESGVARIFDVDITLIDINSVN